MTDKLGEITKKCVRCGQCRSVCPVFRELGAESSAPRGKVFLAHLLENGQLKPSGEARRHLSLCLLCGNCTAECPVGVDVPSLVTAARFKAASTAVQFLTFPVESVLANRQLTIPAMRLGARFIKLTNGKNDHKANAKKQGSWLKNAPGVTKASVGYFIGCATDSCFPEIALDTEYVLKYAGFEVVTPPEPSCCGMPLQAMGQKEKARHLNSRNLDYFRSKGIRDIVTDCASCCSAMHDLVKQSPELYPQIHIWDLNDFILHHYKLLELESNHLPQRKVTYHDPCHHIRHLKLTAPPRQLLNCLPGVDFTEMDGADRCCGGAGSFMAGHSELSLAIARPKVENILKTGADIVTTSCPSCRLQLDRALKRFGATNIAVQHPIQLLAESLKP